MGWQLGASRRGAAESGMGPGIPLTALDRALRVAEAPSATSLRAKIPLGPGIGLIRGRDRLVDRSEGSGEAPPALRDSRRSRNEERHDVTGRRLDLTRAQ